MIFDTHAHYDDEAFDNDREELLKSLPGAGIGRVVNIASSPESIDECLALAHKYDHVYCALGIHPEHCAEMTEEMLEEIRGKLSDEKALAVGEIGLDHYWPEPDPKIQEYWFERQLRLAAEVGLPVVIHSREAAADTLRIMKENHAENIGGVLHCYSYSVELAREFLKMGFYIGIGGVVTFKNARKLVEVAKEIPLERILLETDCPYLAPVPFRGKRNSSLYLPYVVTKIAEIKGISEEEVIRVTEKNAEKMYGLS
ncbi:MAG TPA: hydrolase TatD [Lachnospiraceae bacterium]|nr:hydrolase TatD [Lachnospiraceae bacterium]